MTCTAQRLQQAVPTHRLIHVPSAWCVTNSSFAFWSFLEIFFPQIRSICGLLNLWTQNPQIWRANGIPFGVYSTSCPYDLMSSVSFGKFCYYLCKTHICPISAFLSQTPVPCTWGLGHRAPFRPVLPPPSPANRFLLSVPSFGLDVLRWPVFAVTNPLFSCA